ncbi:hypothetical protein Tdes44962_MAKER08359 [Teratosphaeria destructans]|uniref:Uncharacterized protein n=1 Tax=Teratosphaeria destructans TaxID=418781 RepID=A0A9W7SWR7_9PEZI|nr:hypothetical protein Tdes44962_MAKER08359 [Teratosphaeria destructans]
MLSTPSSSPPSAGFLSNRSLNNGLSPASPRSVRAYSRAMSVSGAPASSNSKATSTPVRSLPAVQCTRIGRGLGWARCLKILA